MSTQVLFSANQNIQSILLEKIRSATHSIHVAVAWFTNVTLFEALVQKSREGVTVQLIIAKHEINDKCKITFSKLSQNGGSFSEIPAYSGLMHNKFCIIDLDILINGSYNWTYSANNSNSENITILEGESEVVNQFVEEFQRLKKLTNSTNSSTAAAIDNVKTIKYFNLIKAFITIGDSNQIKSYLHEIPTTEQTEEIIKNLLASKYDLAIIAIDKFISSQNQLVSVSDVELNFLKSQISLFERMLDSIVVERSYIEVKIAQFTHRFVLELNPLLLKIISLKRKIYAKLKKHGYTNNEYEQIEEELKESNRTYKEQYQEEAEIEIPNLNEEDSATIKSLYKEAAKLCHPDSSKLILGDKKKAEEIFAQLHDAYKVNNLDEVKNILYQLKNDPENFNHLQSSQIDLLRARLETLKAKYRSFLIEIGLLKQSEYYQILIEYGEDIDTYFNEQKGLLKNQLNDLNQNFAT